VTRHFSDIQTQLGLNIPSQKALVVEVKYWRTNREAPAAAGVAIDVPVQSNNTVKN